MRQIRVVSPKLKQRQVIRRPTPYVRARRRYWRRRSAVVLPNVILALVPDTHPSRLEATYRVTPLAPIHVYFLQRGLRFDCLKGRNESLGLANSRK